MHTTVTKIYADIPFAHRQHAHDGHCAQIHGHNWSFAFEFGCKKPEPGTGFVVDFGKLKPLKEAIDAQFDHALVLNEDDPMLEYLQNTLDSGETPEDMDTPARTKPLAKILAVPNCSCEGLCAYLLILVTEHLQFLTKGRVYLVSVTVQEDHKNSATLRVE